MIPSHPSTKAATPPPIPQAHGRAPNGTWKWLVCVIIGMAILILMLASVVFYQFIKQPGSLSDIGKTSNQDDFTIARDFASEELLAREKANQSLQRELQQQREIAAYEVAISGDKEECEQYLVIYGNSPSAAVVRSRLKTFTDLERDTWIVEGLKSSISDRATAIQKGFHLLSSLESCDYEGCVKQGDSYTLRFVNRWNTHWDKKPMTTHFSVTADAAGNIKDIRSTSCSYTLSECGMTADIIRQIAEEIRNSQK